MIDIDDFVESSVKIEKQHNGEFGYFPFHCFVENKNGKFDFVVIAGVNSVEECYKLMAMYIGQSCKRIYMALDFPAVEDIKSDFVVVFSNEGEKFNVFALPYNKITGEPYDRIDHCEALIKIVTDLRNISLKSMFNDFVSKN